MLTEARDKLERAIDSASLRVKTAETANRRVAKEVLRKRILGHLRAPVGQAGLTCEEAEYLTGLSHQSCSARFSELKREGLIVKVGTRNTKTGSPAGVYRLA